MTFRVIHFNPNAVTVTEERRLRRARLDRLDRTDFGNAGVTDTAFIDRLSRPPLRIAGLPGPPPGCGVRAGPRAEDSAMGRGGVFPRMQNQQGKANRSVAPGVGP